MSSFKEHILETETKQGTESGIPYPIVQRTSPVLNVSMYPITRTKGRQMGGTHNGSGRLLLSASACCYESLRCKIQRQTCTCGQPSRITEKKRANTYDARKALSSITEPRSYFKRLAAKE